MSVCQPEKRLCFGTFQWTVKFNDVSVVSCEQLSFMTEFTVSPLESKLG